MKLDLTRYTKGYHGTSLSRAERIREEGFVTIDDRPICIATPLNPDLAHLFGSLKAVDDDESHYALLELEFPETEVELWPIDLQVRINPEEVESIVVRGLHEFRANNPTANRSSSVRKNYSATHDVRPLAIEQPITAAKLSLPIESESYRLNLTQLDKF